MTRHRTNFERRDTVILKYHTAPKRINTSFHIDAKFPVLGNHAAVSTPGQRVLLKLPFPAKSLDGIERFCRRINTRINLEANCGNTSQKAEAPLYFTARLLADSSHAWTGQLGKTSRNLLPLLKYPLSGQLPSSINFLPPSFISFEQFFSNIHPLRPVSLRSRVSSYI